MSEPIQGESGQLESTNVGSHDLATLSAAAEFVINLSICAKNHQIYGSDHPSAVSSAEKLEATLVRVLDLCDPLELHFTPGAIFCGIQCLERGHPIYRRFADRMWRLGIAGLAFARGVSLTETDQLLTLFNLSQVENWSRRDTEQSLRAADMPHIGLEFLHELVSYRPSDEVSKISRAEQETLWEDFMAQLARFRSLGPAPTSSPTRSSEPQIRLTEDTPRSEEGYAEAVIEYMKQLQRSQRQDLLMEQTEFGRKISTFLGEVNPDLRHQIMSSAIQAPEISPETLQRLVNLVGQDQLIESLQRLNSSGGTIPPTAFRALSLLSLVKDPSQTDADSKASSVSTTAAGEDLNRLLDGLMAADRANTYTSTEYEQTISNIEGQAQRLVQGFETTTFNLSLSPNDAEKHFLFAAEIVLDQNPDDVELAQRIDSEAENAYSYFVKASVPSQCRQAMRLARRARDQSGEALHAPYIWETEEVLETLTEQLTAGDRWVSEDSSQLLTTIGSAAVPALLEILLSSDSITARKRAIGTLVTMKENPSPRLLPYLEPSEPWYVQRNIVHILRRRQDASGANAAKLCWRTRRRRLQLEILDYLLTVADPEATDYLWSCLQHPDRMMVLDATRTALEHPRAEVVETIEQRIDNLPSVLVGSRYHLSLLRFMTRSRSSQARAYVEQTLELRQPLFTWTRRRFRQEVEELLRE
ncbi:MAG: HEAT repeat domain-containing protein [Thermoanaerobaculia bacterium]|nr:HEAT repeat domain-containing protein [Thermoanaerobaculia bacterium]